MTMPRKKQAEPREPGRPTENGRPARRIYVTLDEETIAKAKAVGGGNVSAGIRIKFERVKLPTE